jgi:hypothetical protein
MRTRYTIYCTWESEKNGFQVNYSEFHFRLRSASKVIDIIKKLPVNYVSITINRFKWGFIEMPREVGITLREKEIRDIKLGTQVFLSTLRDIGERSE